MQRIISTLAVLGLVTAAFIAVGPSQQAKATVTWPQEFSDTGITQVVARGDDNLTLLSCNFTSVPSTNAFTDVTDGVESGSYPQNGLFGCDPRNGSQPNNDITSPDGTVYGTYLDTSTSPSTMYLEAAKNGKIKWDVSLNYDSGCSGVAGVGHAPTSLSIGADGNVYMIEADGQYNPYCNQYLLGVNLETGAIIDRVNLGKFVSYVGVKPSVWTYSDKIVTVGVNGEIHQYGYDFVEDTGAQYTFPGTAPDGTVMADAAGNVYQIGDSTIYFHGVDSVNSSHAKYSGVFYTTGPSGQLVAYYNGGAIYNLHMDQTTPSVTGLTPTHPSGYTIATAFYANPYLIEDTDGNVVETLQMTQTSTGYPAVDVVYIDVSTGATTSLYMRTGDGTSTGNAIAGQADIYGGYLYLPIGHGTTAGTDSYIEKIDVASAGFGTPVRNTDGFAATTSAGLDYVAMGDSFSSGHGNGNYTPDSSVSGTGGDQCNRSSISYPYDVTSLVSLHLDTFAACSGATTTDMINGKYGEVSQLSALSDQTEVVSMTAGGDDVGFVAFAAACFAALCGSSSAPYTTIMSSINSSGFGTDLRSLYEDVLSDAPNAQVYVLDYPLVAPPYVTSCGGFDLSTAYDVQTALNSVISASVGDVQAENTDFGARLHYVATNYTGSPFTGHTLCDTSPDFIPLDGGNSLHPNSDGQAAYATVLANAITTPGY